MRNFTLAIPQNPAEKQAELARRQYRAPQRQAAAMVVEAVERAAETPTERMAQERREAVSR
jgi:hypothetical protein